MKDSRFVARASGSNVEKVFTVAPGRDPGGIRVRVSGAESLSVDAVGDPARRLSQAPSASPRRSRSSTRPTVRANQSTSATPGVVQTTHTLDSGRGDAFVAAFSPDLATLQALTYFRGSGDDLPWSIPIGPGGQVFIAGQTTSTNLAGRRARRRTLDTRRRATAP